MDPVLALTVPAADPVAHPGVPTEAPRLRAWVEALPYAKPEDAAARLLERLYRLNRTYVRAAQRRELMALMEHGFERLFRLFLERMLAVRTPRHDRSHRRYVILVRELSTEMAFGYKLVIQPREGPRHADATGLSLYRAIRKLELGLTFASADYCPPPGSAWREIYQLYAEAERRVLTENAFTDRSWLSPDTASIAQLFKRAVLLAMIDPYRLLPGEVWHANEYLAGCAGNARLGPLDASSAGAGTGIVDLAGAKPPAPFSPERAYQPAEQFRMIDPRPLGELLERQRNGLEGPDPILPAGLDAMQPFRAAQLLGRMEQSWLDPAHRETERQACYDWLPVACGIQAIVGQLREPMHSADDYWPASDPPAWSGQAASHLPETPAGSLPSWRQFNCSAGGLGMKVRLPAPPELRVGQLLLIQSSAAPSAKGPQVGVVRRMIERDGTDVEIGIQLLGDRVRPVAVRPVVVGRAPTPDFQPALLLDRPDLDDRGELITPCHLFRQDRELIVDLGNADLRVGPVRLIEASPWIERFEYRVTLRGQPR
jgi:hypothetical protein